MKKIIIYLNSFSVSTDLGNRYIKDIAYAFSSSTTNLLHLKSDSGSSLISYLTIHVFETKLNKKKAIQKL